MGKQVKAKSDVIVISSSPKQDEATVKILDLAPKYGVTICKAPKIENGVLIPGGQRAVEKNFRKGVMFSMWANKENGKRVLAVLKPEGNALSIKESDATIHTVKA